MKKIIINSPKYGVKEVLIDEDDFELISSYTWCIAKRRNTFYAISGGNKRVLMHRLIMKANGRWNLIDHIDRNGLNCQKENLRKSTNSQNIANSKSRKNASSKYLGVHFYTNKYKGEVTSSKWCARITKNYKGINLGYFENEIDAAKAYDEAAKKYHGEFANLNFK